MPDLLEICDLSGTYPDGTEALWGLGLSVAPGERVGLIGPNGSGKTTLLLAVMGALPFKGHIAVDGVALSRRSGDEVRSRCGMTFQDAEDQLFMPTLLDDAAFGPLNQGNDTAEAERRARQAIAAVGLAGFEARSAHHLSGGEKQCAALATILSMQVKLLLLDEPGASLDFRSRRRLIDLLRGRQEAMLLATHDLDMVSQLCNRVVLTRDGRIAADAPTDTILSDSALLAQHHLA